MSNLFHGLGWAAVNGKSYKSQKEAFDSYGQKCLHCYSKEPRPTKWGEAIDAEYTEETEVKSLPDLKGSASE